MNKKCLEEQDDEYADSWHEDRSYEPASSTRKKRLFTQRRRHIEDKLEMLKIKREYDIEEDFHF